MATDWREEARCRSVDPEMWFPNTGQMSHENHMAVKICQGCPVKEPCLEAGLDAEFGIFGGLTGPERSSLRHKRRLSQRSLGTFDDRDVCRCAGCGGWMLRTSGCQLCSKAAQNERDHAA